MRVLAVAERNDATIESAEQGMTFLGIAGMIDPPRAEAKAAVATCHRAGIRPIMKPRATTPRRPRPSPGSSASGARVPP